MAKIQIKVILQKGQCADCIGSKTQCYCDCTLAAVVTNLDKKESLIVHYPDIENNVLIDANNQIIKYSERLKYYFSEHYIEKNVDVTLKAKDAKHYETKVALLKQKGMNEKKRAEENITTWIKITNECLSNYSVIVLNTSGDFDRFLTLYQQKFDVEVHKNFRRYTNNCSSAVNFVLTHFYPNENGLRRAYTAYQTAFCTLSLGGMFNRVPFLPAAPCGTTPIDVHRLAKWYACCAKPSAEAKPSTISPRTIAGPPAQTMEKIALLPKAATHYASFHTTKHRATPPSNPVAELESSNHSPS